MRGADACDHENSFLPRRGTHYVPRSARETPRGQIRQSGLTGAGDNVSIGSKRNGRGRLAHAPGDRGVRLPDRLDQLRAAFVARLFPDADVAGASLGPRRVRDRARHPESAVGYRPAVCGRALPTASAPTAC